MPEHKNGVEAAKAAKPRLRLEYLDGLRGLAALYVVLFHTQLAATFRIGGIPEWVRLGTSWMQFGRYAVSVFIVLSGYCLMLPVARSADGKLRGGAGEYLKRRARRILPPYYAALLLSMLLIALVPGLRRESGTWWDHALPAFRTDIVLSHLVLIHNFSPDWWLKIDGTLWSVATEWQIYFFFPALLLPIWRRFGLGALLIVAFAIGLIPHFLLREGRNFDQAAPWFLGLFALGMAGAVIGFSNRRTLQAMRERMPWGWLAGLFALIFLGVAAYSLAMHRDWLWNEAKIWIIDAVVGMAATCLIIYCTRALTEQPDAPRPDVLHLLESRWAVELGVFSYSLYLIHAPILGATHLVLRNLSLSPGAAFGLMFVFGVPLSLGLSYLFHLAFERRFMPGHPRTETQAAKSAALSPAP